MMWVNLFSTQYHLISISAVSTAPPDAKTYGHNLLDKKSVVDRHRCHIAAKFGVFVYEDHSKIPTLYWLPKLHKRPYKSRFIANSGSCTTTELTIVLTSCLTAIKNHVIKCYATVF